MRLSLKPPCELLWLAWLSLLGLGSRNSPSIMLNFLQDKLHYHYGCYSAHHFDRHIHSEHEHCKVSGLTVILAILKHI